VDIASFWFPPFFETGNRTGIPLSIATLPGPCRNDNSDKLQFFLQARIYELPKNNTISKITDSADGIARYAIMNPLFTSSAVMIMEGPEQ